MKISFVSGTGPIVANTEEGARFYVDTLGIKFPDRNASYLMTDDLPGVKHFGIWPLRECSLSCLGTDHWPSDRIVQHPNLQTGATT